MLLKDFALFYHGLPTKRTLEVKTDYVYKVLRPLDFDENNILKEKTFLLKYYSKRSINTDILLKQGDLIIKILPPYSIIKVKNNWIGWTVSSNFIIIRPINIAQEVLHYLLIKNIKNIENKSNGSNMKVIRMSVLKSLNLIKEESDEIINEKIKSLDSINNLIEKTTKKMILLKKIKYKLINEI